jgi:hypothetical protein
MDVEERSEAPVLFLSKCYNVPTYHFLLLFLFTILAMIMIAILL